MIQSPDVSGPDDVDRERLVRLGVIGPADAIGLRIDWQALPEPMSTCHRAEDYTPVSAVREAKPRLMHAIGIDRAAEGFARACFRRKLSALVA